MRVKFFYMVFLGVFALSIPGMTAHAASFPHLAFAAAQQGQAFTGKVESVTDTQIVVSNESGQKTFAIVPKTGLPDKPIAKGSKVRVSYLETDKMPVATSVEII